MINQSNCKEINEISSLVAKEELAIYLDFHSVKNGRELIEYLNRKAKRLKAIGLANNQILKILIIGDNLKENILNKKHYRMFKKYLIQNIDLITVDTRKISNKP